MHLSIFSVVTNSGGESSEPSSPSRPATPMPPLPTQHCPYECLRADSEDSGLGPSPAKSLVNPTSPASPLQFCNDSDSLLDLSPRTDNSYESDKSPDDTFYNLEKTPAKSGSAFKFLLSSSVNGSTTQFLRGGESSTESSPPPFCEDDHQFETSPCTDGSSPEDYHRQTTPSPLLADGESSTSPSSFFDEQACQDHPFQTTSHCGDSPHRQTTQFPSPLLGRDESSTSPNSFFDEQACRDDDHPFQTIQNSHHRLNPQVLLIRSNYSDGGGFTELTTTSSDCTSSNCSQVDPQSSSTSGSSDDGDCKWLGCHRLADDNTTETDLIDHIRQCHVQSQPDDNKSYVCLWIGCKVYDRPSCSRSWLERHVLLHGGSKPFRCIVDGCRQRFSSEGILERHVNSHFPHKERSHRERFIRRRRHKYRRRPQSNKAKDFFDDASMEHVRHNLFQLSSIEGMNCGGPPSAITFHSTVVGRRVDPTGKVHILLHWNPEDMIPDSWIPESEILSNLQKTIPLSKLPRQALQLPSMVALSKTGIVARPGKRKRK
ncbi:Zinc finger protein AEBP2 like protein [Argiope bruennichi]|uniref:Zinc finger protein AEBP2 like protein n=1 Tax=Argiope bruennichi TaxID=94029 RepID=A0A8T0ECY3_ARGBR|nr:Zinc finger protein AEBP2 like protein [Argiope bruennichi]